MGPTAKACGVVYQAVQKWRAKGRLPRTEHTGETNHAERIAAAAAQRGVLIDVDALRGAGYPRK